MLGNALNNKSAAVDENYGNYSISELWTRLGFYLANENRRQRNANYLFGYWGSFYDNPEVTDFLLAPDNSSEEDFINKNIVLDLSITLE